MFSDSVASGCSVENCVAADCCDDTSCSQCMGSFYLKSGYCYRCNHKNCKCSSASNCIGCLPGKFDTGVYCNSDCPVNCIECVSSYSCSKCKPGKYGRCCELDCLTTCLNRTCDKATGICSNECPVGYHLNNDNCKPCPPRCESCVDIHNCTSCSKYYHWGNACQFDCTGCYSMCSRGNGCSSGCDSNYYLTYSEHFNGFQCTHCPRGCSKCKNMTLCLMCISGFYLQKTTNITVCQECPENCEICLDDTNCDLCYKGYYITYGTNCVKCPNNCKDDMLYGMAWMSWHGKRYGIAGMA